MKKRIVSSVAAAVLLSGCATQPEEIHTQSVSAIQYQNYDCDQIGLEMARVSRRVNELYGRLKKLANDDEAQMGIGLIFFWPALFFLEGSDSPEAAEYGRLKGEYEALEVVAVQKKCVIPESSRIARYATQAVSTAKEACDTARIPNLIANTGAVETYESQCSDGRALVVQCQASGCKVLQ